MDDTVVLVVDHDDEKRHETVECVGTELSSVTVLAAGTRQEARKQFEENHVDVLVTGQDLPDGNGLELSKQAREVNSGTGCILYTSTETVDTESFEDVVVEFVGKETPSAAENLVALVREAGQGMTQSAHPVSATEQTRLAAAMAALETADAIETPLEKVTRLAREQLAATAGTVAVLLRDRQEPVAGDEKAPREREDSLATHTLVADDGVMSVKDTRTDPRFEHVETVQSAGIVSYLGATVESPDGDPIGVLSVYDDQPREFSSADREYLRELAALSSDLFALGAGGDQQ